MANPLQMFGDFDGSSTLREQIKQLKETSERQRIANLELRKENEQLKAEKIEFIKFKLAVKLIVEPEIREKIRLAIND